MAGRHSGEPSRACCSGACWQSVIDLLAVVIVRQTRGAAAAIETWWPLAAAMLPAQLLSKLCSPARSRFNRRRAMQRPSRPGCRRWRRCCCATAQPMSEPSQIHLCTTGGGQRGGHRDVVAAGGGGCCSAFVPMFTTMCVCVCSNRRRVTRRPSRPGGRRWRRRCGRSGSCTARSMGERSAAWRKTPSPPQPPLYKTPRVPSPSVRVHHSSQLDQKPSGYQQAIGLQPASTSVMGLFAGLRLAEHCLCWPVSRQAAAWCAGSGPMDGQLFMIKQLLVLREQIAPFQVCHHVTDLGAPSCLLPVALLGPH